MQVRYFYIASAACYSLFCGVMLNAAPKMSKEIKTLAEFHTAITSHKPTVIKFYADWCGACKQMAPGFEKAAESMPDVQFIKVNVNTNELKNIVDSYGVTAMPTIVIKTIGSLSAEEFSQRVHAFLGKEAHKESHLVGAAHKEEKKHLEPCVKKEQKPKKEKQDMQKKVRRGKKHQDSHDE